MTKKNKIILVAIALLTIGLFAILQNIRGLTLTGAIDTSDWQLLKNTKYGYEIEYPKDWFVTGTDDSMTLQTPFEEKSATGISFLVKQWPREWTLDDLVLDMYIDYSSLASLTTVTPEVSTFAGYNARFVVDPDVINREEGINYFLKNENMGLQIGIWPGSVVGDKKIKALFSTFRLIRPTVSDDTSDWRTYKNEKYGYEFKYPEDSRVTGNITSLIDQDGYHVYLPATPTSTVILIDGGAAFNVDVVEGGLREDLGSTTTFLGNPARKEIQEGAGIDYQILHNNRVYWISTYDLTGRMYSIITTFKFIE